MCALWWNLYRGWLDQLEEIPVIYGVINTETGRHPSIYRVTFTDQTETEQSEGAGLAA